MLLRKKYDVLEEIGSINLNVPDSILNNINPVFSLREYQRKAINRFINYLEEYPKRIRPTQLLFHMATGSGKTLLMAANILYLYQMGYRNFLFFVNSTNIIEKTKDNFLNKQSSKYLFNKKIIIDGKDIKINFVRNFDESGKDDINIVFATIQELYSNVNVPKENTLTFEDFTNEKIVFISDEAHHINAWTKIGLNKTESIKKNTWEHTVNKLFNSNSENILLEYTATLDLENKAIQSKYENKIIFEYSLKEFRLDGYSKEVKVLQADLDNVDRMLQAIILSQYRRKIAEKHKIRLKPVILFKSKTIKDSENNFEVFQDRIENLSNDELEKIKLQSTGSVLENAFTFFESENISLDNLLTELKEDFCKEKSLILDSNNIDEKKQLRLNSLEDVNNEVRAIFAVNMLNEGWDVLNLFDIVRLYDTRDSRSNQPGKTTISEAQLIGRGARYYPFKWADDSDQFKRKFDQEPEKEMKIVEELYYHSAQNPRYIQELKIALRDTGILPPQEPKTIFLKVKENIKTTDFWKKTYLCLNEKIKSDRSTIMDINDLEISNNYGIYYLKTGFTSDQKIFEEDSENEEEKITSQIELGNFSHTILQKSVAKIEFYKFNNLKNYFPNLKSMKQFVESLKKIKVDVRTSKTKLANLTPDDKLEISLYVLQQLKSQIKTTYTEYEGTKVFVEKKLEEIVKDKTMKINVGDFNDREFGTAMSQTTNQDLRLNLSNYDWYVYDENYGTSEEKHYIQFLNGIMEKLKPNYSQIYLLRNANLFKIFRFSDGKAIEPDFVLFLKSKSSEKIIQYQLFIEPKGDHLVKTDEWKEEFLTTIENNFKVDTIVENEEYRLIGLPFFNQDLRNKFIDTFKKKIDIK